MDDYYSDSALSRAYRETGLSNRQIQAVVEVLEACAHFYAVLELKEVWRIAGAELPVTRAEYENLLAVFQKDPYTRFDIMNEQDFYDDGEDIPLLIDSVYFCVYNTKFKPKKGSVASTPNLLCWDEKRFDSLYAQREGKRLFVPPDLLDYSDPDYYTETQYTDALLKFLEKNLPKDIDPEDALLEAIRRIREEEKVSAKMAVFLWDRLAPENQTEANMDEYLKLYEDFQNHTPMPHNRGAAPRDVRLEDRRPSYTPASFGVPRFANGIGTEEPEGRLDFDRIAEFARANPGLQYGSGSGGTLRNRKKVGPNEPCPCGSGKKYKKCCGSR